tara:strand:- start:104 stop:241 length:138 start_codon:yes stop_codon:yes gene_type:complete
MNAKVQPEDEKQSFVVPLVQSSTVLSSVAQAQLLSRAKKCDASAM